jgi:WD40 repeat protein
MSFWDITTGELIKSMQTGDQGQLHSINYSPDGKILASASWDESVKIWNISTTDLITTLEHEFSPWTVAFSPDGKLLATSEGKRNTYEDKTFPIHDPVIRIYDTTTFEVVQKLKGHTTAIDRVLFSPTGTLSPPVLASGDITGEIRLWKQQEIEEVGNGVTGFDLFSGVTLCVAISLVIKQSNSRKRR